MNLLTVMELLLLLFTEHPSLAAIVPVTELSIQRRRRTRIRTRNASVIAILDTLLRKAPMELLPQVMELLL